MFVMLSRTLIRAFVIVVVWSSTSALAQDPPPIRSFDITKIEALGAEIAEQDAIAVKATDILLAQRINLNDIPLRGWVVSKTEGEYIVTFVGEYESRYLGIFEIRPNASLEKQFLAHTKLALPQELLLQFKARQLAAKFISPACSNRYNTVALREQGTQAWLVYALAPATDPDLVPIGGHFRFTIDASGEKLIQKDRLSMSCLAMNKHSKDMPAGSTLVALNVTHIVSDTPVETHVYLNLINRLDLIVVTMDKTVWKISGGKISKGGFFR